MDQSSDESDDDDDDAVVVDESYTPNVVSAGATLNERARTMVVDPISGKSVPIDQLEEHMRIQLLDPKWAEQRRVFMDRQKETNLGAGDIADYVARFVNAQKSAMAGDSANAATTTSIATAATVQQPQPLPQPQPQPQPPMMDPANQLYLQQQQQQQQQQYMYQQQLLQQQQQQYGVVMPYPQQPPMPPHYPMPPLPPTSVMPPPLPPGLPPTGMPPAALAPGLQPPLPPPPLPPGHPPPPTVSIAVLAAPDERATQGDGDGDGEDATVPPSKRPRIAENEHDDDDDVQDAANMDTNEPPPPPPPPQRRSFPATFSLRVRCPDEDWPLWKLTAGAILTFDGVEGSTATVWSVKERIHERLDGSMPLNKMKLRVPSSGDILKDDEALLRDCQGLLPEESEEDEGEGETAAVVALDLVPKVRGGRK